MNVLNTQCPLVRSTHNENAPGDGSPWHISASGNACKIFSAEFSAVTNMIKNAQEIVTQAQTLNASQKNNQNAPQDFNPYTSSDRAFAQNMLNHAQAQAKMLELADQIKKTLTLSQAILSQITWHHAKQMAQHLIKGLLLTLGELVARM